MWVTSCGGFEYGIHTPLALEQLYKAKQQKRSHLFNLKWEFFYIRWQKCKGLHEIKLSISALVCLKLPFRLALLEKMYLNKIQSIWKLLKILTEHVFLFSMSGPNSSSEWSIEGRRLVPLMPRLVPQTAFTVTANAVANAAVQHNASLPVPAETGNKEGERKMGFCCTLQECKNSVTVKIDVLDFKC